MVSSDDQVLSTQAESLIYMLMSHHIKWEVGLLSLLRFDGAFRFKVMGKFKGFLWVLMSWVEEGGSFKFCLLFF